MAKIHTLKCWPEVFKVSKKRVKTAEYRLNDRDYQVGDVLVQQEWDPEAKQYSGEMISQRITHIVHGCQFGIPQDYVVMSVKRVDVDEYDPESIVRGIEMLRDAFWETVGPIDEIAKRLIEEVRDGKH